MNCKQLYTALIVKKKKKNHNWVLYITVYFQILYYTCSMSSVWTLHRVKKKTTTSQKQSRDQEQSLHSGCSPGVRHKLINTKRRIMFWACCSEFAHLGSSFQLVDSALSRWKYLCQQPAAMISQLLHQQSQGCMFKASEVAWAALSLIM